MLDDLRIAVRLSDASKAITLPITPLRDSPTTDLACIIVLSRYTVLHMRG